MMRHLIPTIATFLLILPMMANASLIGATVNQSYYYPDNSSLFCDNGNAVVGASVEYATDCLGFDLVVTDIFDTYLTVETGGIGWNSASFNGFLLSILTGPDIVSASYGGGSMSVTSLTVDSGNLWVNFEGQAGGFARIDFATSVPEPSTFGLLGIGLLVLSLARRRPLI